MVSARRLRRESGFTLIELLVVVLIIGILIAVSAPSFLGQTKKAQESAAKQYLTVAWKSAKSDAVDNPQGQGLYRSASSVASAIAASEPELSATTAAVSSSSSPSTINVAVSSPNAAGSTLTLTDYAADGVQCQLSDTTSGTFSPASCGTVASAPSFSPTQISGLYTWLDASQMTSLSNGQSVASWTDASGQGEAATQSTPANQPTYVQNAVNGLPALHSSGSALLSLPNPNSPSFTIFVVARRTTSATANVIANRNYSGGVVTGMSMGFNSTAANGLNADSAFFFNGTGANYNSGRTTPTGSSPASTWQVLSADWSDGNSTPLAMTINGASQTLTDWTAAPTTNTMYWSGTSTPLGLFNSTVAYSQDAPLTGDIAEVIVYTRALSAAETAQVTSYLKTKYGL